MVKIPQYQQDSDNQLANHNTKFEGKVLVDLSGMHRLKADLSEVASIIEERSPKSAVSIRHSHMYTQPMLKKKQLIVFLRVGWGDTTGFHQQVHAREGGVLH